MVAGGAAPTIVLDYGKDIGGVPYFDVTTESGSPTLRAAYSEGQQYLTATGDAGNPWGEGDSARYDSYSVTGPGTITNSFVQGGQRFEEITLTSPGTLTLADAGVNYIADQSSYRGSFLSSSDELNKIWYDGAYTAQLDSIPDGSLPGYWQIHDGVMDAAGNSGNDGAGVLTTGTSWTDYTDTFDAKIVANQAGWMVRAQDATDGYLFILNADNDTTGTPNTLQELSVHDGNYTILGMVPLTTDLAPNTWHTVATAVTGPSIAISLDGNKIATLDSNSLPAGATAYSSGTVGFREYSGEEADFRNLSVVDGSGASLYENALSTSADLSTVDVPGVNTVPSIVDGAKRDRAIWVGDMNVEGPTTYYSTDAADYIKGSLQLLGSYQLTSGFVTGALPPQDPVHTGPLTPGTTGTYSASYSMYWVLGLGSYYLYTGDTAFVTQELPTLERELAWNASTVDANGLLVTDNNDGSDWDYYDGPKTGEVTEYNVLYYKALLDGAELADAAGQGAQASTYRQQAAALKIAINTRLFNSATGLYDISDSRTTGVAQDTNALAVLYGVAPTGADSSILAKLKSALWTTPYGPVPYTADTGWSSIISPYSGGYELDARLASNDTADAESLLTTEWGHMISAGPDDTATMWENVASGDGTPGIGSATSLAHGWSTTPTAALSGYVLGIQPVTAGYATWVVQPHPGDLSWAQGQAPTPHGAVGVSWNSQSGAGRFGMTVTAPSGTSGTIAVPTFGGKPVVVVNGRVVWNATSFMPAPGISGAHSDGSYIYLTVARAGAYQVSAAPRGH
jgi:alpha-L-rhamnosidase